MQINDNIRIGGLVKFSMLDYPGKLSTVIFCQGCPNRCPYCHNHELQPLERASEISIASILDFLRTRQGLIEAVVFSGGEPLIQSGIGDAIARIKELGFLIGLHTSGTNPETLESIINQVDWVGLDIKTQFGKYSTITGNATSGRSAKESLELLLRYSKPYEIRTTVDMAIISFNDLVEIARMLKRYSISSWILQKCRPMHRGVINQFITEEELRYLRQIITIEVRDR